MSGFLRVLGALVIAIGLVVAGAAGWLLAEDTHFVEIAAAYARHPDHALFQGEYWAAAARHYGLLTAVAGGLLGGLAVGGMLLALGELLARVPRR